MKINSQKVTFQGPIGEIEGILDLPEKLSSTPEYFSVNCHPHSLHGGTMTNKVVYTVSRAIAGLGIPSLRFNFRGVGATEGEYDEGKGEQQDLAAAVAWMQTQYPTAKLLLSGFSFGSYVSAFAAKTLSPTLLLSIAPPVQRFDFSLFSQPDSDWTVVIGDKDELVEFTEVKNWVANFDPQLNFIVMEDAGHFFHGRLVELREHIETVVSEHIEKR